MKATDKLFAELKLSPFDGHWYPGHCATYSSATPHALTLNIASAGEEKITQQLFAME